jgi:D-alanyl-D-alanine dipeptidase
MMTVPESWALGTAMALLTASALAQTVSPPVTVQPWPREVENTAWRRPAPPSAALASLIGEYGAETEPLYVYERNGHLFATLGRGAETSVEPDWFTRDAAGRGTTVIVGGSRYDRRHVGPDDGMAQLHVKPLRPVADVLREALLTEPPAEAGDFVPAELVEVASLDPTIKLDIRYASTNNFLESVFYAEPRAFLQRPAAEALVRVHESLARSGYGLLLHDGYRPWYVTKAFWDATPDDKKWLVANPASGSRHNRGAAVDLTLYELTSGHTVEMPSTYDESTPRAFAFYPGGSELQRWHRALLRRAMEAEGFTVNPSEWWHFDYKDSSKYAIGNRPFSDVK